MKKSSDLWEIWCKALGEKSHKDDNERSDQVAVVRSFIVLLNAITCIFIILNAVATHGWRLVGL